MIERLSRPKASQTRQLYPTSRSYNRSMQAYAGTNGKLRSSLSAILFSLLLGYSTPPANAYSVQSHQQLVDLSWKPAIEPLLLARYPNLTAGQLREAHAYAYGGCAIQDLGYYPFGDEFFSNLLHYVRSGDFVQQLLHDAESPDELAFALGALSHYVGDSLGHSLATNDAVPVEFPKLRKKYGSWVTYDENPHAHVQAEFAFDVNQISKGRFAPVAYLESVGLQVPVPLLARAFQETYGIPLRDVLGGSQRPNLFGYRLSVHHLLPRIAAAEALLHGSKMPADTPGPEFTRMEQALRQSGHDNGWEPFRSSAGAGTYLLAGLVYVTPKLSAATMLDIKGPTVHTEEEYVHSLDRSIDTMSYLLHGLATDPLAVAGHLPNRDLDTGEEVQPGAYRLTDLTYRKLLHRLTHKPFYNAPAELKSNVAQYYSSKAAFGAHLSAAQWNSIQADISRLQDSHFVSEEESDAGGDDSTGWSSMFFSGWMSLWRVLLVGVPGYLALVLLLRISGKRTLSKMNAFDFVVTVALGSTFATILLSTSVALVEGLLAFITLILLQLIITWLSVRSSKFSHLVKASPRLLFHSGAFLFKAMKAERVTEQEVLAAIRTSGYADLESVGAVVLETDGSISVLPKAVSDERALLNGVDGADEVVSKGKRKE